LLNKHSIIVLLSLLFATPSYAGIIDLPSYISGNDVSINNLQTTNTTIENWANGNVEGGINIKAGSIVSQDLSQSISTITRWQESFGNFTYTGMLPVTDASLTSTISAGTSYVTGFRVVIGATAHTYTASRDTYVYVNQGGYYNYDEVANGASAPTNYTSANGNLLLAKVVTSGTAITSVEDLRTLSLPITVTTSNFPSDYRDGAMVSIDSTTNVHVEPGQIAIGTSQYTTTADTSSKSVATASNWIEGSAPNIKNLKFYVYAYNNSGSQFDFKYASADPVYSDTSDNTGGTLRYYETGGVTYRALAWISGDTNATILGSSMGQIQDINTQNTVTFVRRDTVTGTGVIPWDNTLPLITEGDQYFAVPFRVSNINHKVKIEYSFSLANSGSTLYTIVLFKDAQTVPFYAAPSQLTAADRVNTFTKTTYTTFPDTNMHIIRLRAGTDTAGTTTLNGEGGSALMGGIMESRVTITEVEG